MVQLCKRIAESSRFQNFITGVILFAGALVGVETYPEMARRFAAPMHVLDQVVLWIFMAEIAIKMIAEGRRPWRYFYDGWNVFDFVIVAGAFSFFDEVEFVPKLLLVWLNLVAVMTGPLSEDPKPHGLVLLAPSHGHRFLST